MPFSCRSCGQYKAPDLLDSGHDSIPVSLPRCHKCNISSDSGPCYLCQRLVQARQRVHVARRTLYLVIKEEQQLMAEINESGDRLLSKLPVEVACRVFGFCIPNTLTTVDFQDDFDDWDDFRFRHTPKPFQLTLGAVCQTWRRVVWSEPRFWESIAIILSHSTPVHHITLIEEWLGRSAQLPLTIRTYFKTAWDEQFNEEVVARTMQPMLSILNSVIHRCSLFFAHIPSAYFGQLRLRHNQTTPLKCLLLESVRHENRSILHTRRWDIGVEGSPASLCLEDFQLQNVHLQWCNLTQFTGRGISGPDCIEVLRGAPKLLSCTLERIIPANFPPSTRLVRSNITHLDTSHGHGGIFHFLTLPSLDSLWCSLSENSFSEVLSQCFIRSACPLEVASFLESGSDDDDLLEFLHLTPGLECLELADMEIGEKFFARLGETSYVSRDKRSIQLLPKLKKFTLNASRNFSWSAVAAMAPRKPPQPGMVRRPLKDINFNIITYPDDGDITSDFWPESWEHLIGEEDLDDMLSMIGSGVKLRIYDEDGGHDILAVSEDYHRATYSSDGDTGS